MPSFH